jgi:hypothetical protein
VVIINSIDRQAFHQLLSPNATSEIAVGAQSEWFADVTETLIGTIGVDERSQGWAYVILKRDAMGNFRVFGRHAHFWTPHSARVMLLRQMVGAEAVGAERLVAQTSTAKCSAF